MKGKDVSDLLVIAISAVIILIIFGMFGVTNVTGSMFTTTISAASMLIPIVIVVGVIGFITLFVFSSDGSTIEGTQNMLAQTEILHVEESQEPEVKVQEVKCEYCSQVYPNTMLKCPNCGAPRTVIPSA